MRSQLLNQQLWITGGEAALQEVCTTFLPVICFHLFIMSGASPRRGEAHYSCAHLAASKSHNDDTRRAAAAICHPVSVSSVSACVCVCRGGGLFLQVALLLLTACQGCIRLPPSFPLSLTPPPTYTHTQTHSDTMSHLHRPVLNMHHCYSTSNLDR